MNNQLQVSVGQYSDKGKKEINQDFYNAKIPKEPLLTTKGIALALADGISSSQVSQIASKAAVNSFLSDYYSTPESWSVSKGAEKVLETTNSWLHSKSKEIDLHDRDKGYVCTFSAMIIRSHIAHFFHVGDSRIYHIRGEKVSQMTEDHRIHISSEQSYLARALGTDARVIVDYSQVEVEEQDIFVLLTDGIYETVSNDAMHQIISENIDNLDLAAKIIVDKAYENGSDDNLTIQIAHVTNLVEDGNSLIYKRLNEQKFPPELHEGMEFDGFSIEKEIHKNSRSYIYLATDKETGDKVVIKCPSMTLRDDKAYIERLIMEEWIAKRVNNSHVLKAYKMGRQRNFLYVIFEFVEGNTLAEWMLYNVNPPMDQVRDIAGQIARALQAFHRQEMIHQDLRPENILINEHNQVTIIDFGSTRVLGLSDMNIFLNEEDILGTAQYSAPEYFIGDVGSYRSDMFSLAVIVYQMISGKFPYEANVARANSKSAQKNLHYNSLYSDEYGIPLWIDETLKKALDVKPYKRYDELSEFIYDLKHPNPKFIRISRAPIYERSPIAFWKAVSIVEAVAIGYLLFKV